MIKIITTLFSISLIACGQQADKRSGNYTPGNTSSVFGGNSSSPSPNKEGGQDSGGGNTVGTNEKHIIEVLKDSERLQSELEEIIKNFDWKAPFLSQNSLVIQRWKQNYIDKKLNLSEVLSNIQIKDKCLDKHGKQKDATVSDFTRSGEICMSTKDLSKIPADSIRKQIHSLLMHEISHLLEFNENNARKIQEIVYAKYDDLLASNNPNHQLKESYIIAAANTKKFLKEVLQKPNQYFTSGQISKDESFWKKYQTFSQLVFPNFIKTTQALKSTIEAQSQTDNRINLKTAKLTLEELELLPYKLDALRAMVYLAKKHNADLNKEFYKQTYFPEYNIQKGNYIFIKQEYQKSLNLLERINFIGLSESKKAWDHEINKEKITLQ